MRGKEFHRRQLARQLRPHRIEALRALHVTPRQAVNMGKQELARRRANQRIQTIDNVTALGNHHPHGARAVACVVGSLEINGGEARHGWRCSVIGQMVSTNSLDARPIPVRRTGQHARVQRGARDELAGKPLPDNPNTRPIAAYTHLLA